MERQARKGALSGLGQGGADDRLPFRLLLRLLVRCLELLRPVRGHLIALFAGFSALALAFLPVGLLLVDAFWTRVLQGLPLTRPEAWLLHLDPARSVAVSALSPELRRVALQRILMVGVGFGFLAVPAGLALYYYQIWILQRVNQLLRLRILDRLQGLSLRFHADSTIGDAIYRLVQDSAMVTQLVEVLFLVPVSAAGRFLFSLAVVALFSPLAALALLALGPPLFGLGLVFSRPLRLRFRRARETQSALTARVQESLAGIRVLKAYGANGFEQARFETASREAFEQALRGRGLLALFQVALFWITGLALALAAGWAALRTSAGDALPWLSDAGFTVWTLGLYSYFELRFADGGGTLRQVFRTWGRVQDVAIGLDRVFELLDLEPEVREAAQALPLPQPKRGIRYTGVRFRYQPERPALEDVSFEARVGTITAIVGPTGAGKTTLMALLLRLFDPEAGRIEIDGVDLRHFRLSSLRDQVAVALQENLLFGTTVRENIRYARPEADDAAVREAARVACADEFIERLPDGYDTLLGERGSKLSAGQRQRLSIARAVLKDAPILVLDEPTASLDAETELRLLRHLSEWGRSRLIFLITHRLSAIRRADQILFLDAGRILESGSHDELLARPGGAYRALRQHEDSVAAAAAREVRA